MKGQIRPTLVLRVECAEQELGRKLAQRLRHKSCSVSGLVAPGRIELHVHGAEQHMWSPQLILEVHEEGGISVLRGRFGPHPSVWTLFMAGYASCALLALVALSFGLAQLTMETPAWGFAGVGVAALLGASISGLAYLGQGLGEAQMDQLRVFLEDSLSDAQLTFRCASSIGEPSRAADVVGPTLLQGSETSEAEVSRPGSPSRKHPQR